MSDREIRAANYAVKQGHNFRCAECGKGFSILVVTEKTTGAQTTRCEGCLDRRSFEVNPGQWDEAERTREKLKKENA